MDRRLGRGDVSDNGIDGKRWRRGACRSRNRHRDSDLSPASILRLSVSLSLSVLLPGPVLLVSLLSAAWGGLRAAGPRLCTACAGLLSTGAGLRAAARAELS